MPMRGLTESELQGKTYQKMELDIEEPIEKHEKLNFDSETKKNVDSLSSFKEMLDARRHTFRDKAFSSMERKPILFWMNTLNVSFEELEKIAKECLK